MDGEFADLFRCLELLRHIPVQYHDFRAFSAQMLQRCPGCNLIAREMHIGDLRDTNSVEGGRQTGDTDVMAGQPDSSGFQPEGVGSDSGSSRAEAG
jgi:hypothetical protein